MERAAASRRRVLLRGLAAGGALAAGPSLALAARASAKATGTELLERAIRLEQEARVVYETLAEGDLLDEEVAAAADAFAAQQREHVEALTAALEDEDVASAPPPPRPGEVEGLDEAESQADGLALAVDLENALVRAYGELAESPATPAVLKTITEIAGNAAQHLVVLRQQLGEPPLPEAFETGAAEEG